MELFLWVLAGAAVGWLGIAKLGLNEDRGTLVSMIIGIAGGVAGGKLIAPMVGAVALVPGEFSVAAMFVALACAVALLAVGNLVNNRFGV